jgi:hypothetical protein
MHPIFGTYSPFHDKELIGRIIIICRIAPWIFFLKKIIHSALPSLRAVGSTNRKPAWKPYGLEAEADK